MPRFVPARVQLARAYGELDRIADGNAAIEVVRELAPRFTLASAEKLFNYIDAENRARLRNGLRKAGLPE